MKYHRTVFNANFRYANVWKTTITLRRRPSVNCEYALSLIIELSLNFHKKFVLMENISQSKVSKCEKCRSCLMDSSNILADISHPLENRLDRSNVAQSTREGTRTGIGAGSDETGPRGGRMQKSSNYTFALSCTCFAWRQSRQPNFFYRT